tara:strand:+ start:216 stop:503 length:288 start_codon:yes stop_codon:yes gene_type:complete
MTNKNDVVVREVKLEATGHITTFPVSASTPRPKTKGKTIGQIRQSLSNGKGVYPDSEGYYYVPISRRSSCPSWHLDTSYGDIFENIDEVIHSLRG